MYTHITAMFRTAISHIVSQGGYHATGYGFLTSLTESTGGARGGGDIHMVITMRCISLINAHAAQMEQCKLDA